MGDYASDSGHWYTKEGETAYTQETKSGPNKGKARNTTIGDARKLGLVPSVTTVLKIVAKPQLEEWKVNQGILAALTYPATEQERSDDKLFLAAVKRDAREHAIKAAQEGARIHGIVERYFRSEYNLEGEILVPLVKAMQEHDVCGKWEPEKSFASPLGYAGKVDLHSKSNGLVVDYKTKDGDEEKFKKVKGYDGELGQLAAYAHGLGMSDARLINIFISRTHPGVIKIHEWTKEESEWGWQYFQDCFALWKTQKRFI